MIKTSWLLLRELNIDDIDFVFKLLSDEKVILYTSKNSLTRDGAERFVKEAISEQQKSLKSRLSYEHVIEYLCQFVGKVFLHITHDNNKTGEIGYHILPEYWGKGFATEALKKMLHFGFKHIKLHRIYGTCSPDNLGSSRVMEKAGMKFEGIMRENKWIERTQKWRDSKLYAIIENDWK